MQIEQICVGKVVRYFYTFGVSYSSEHYTKELKVQLHRIDYPIIIRRTKQRFGWVLARIQGTEYAKGDILIFLDAHTEVTKGWLEPILSRISDNRFVTSTIQQRIK